MSIFGAILLGIVQGLTEFLPVSSSGHLAVTQHFLPGFHQPGVLFDIILHLGTLLAVLIYFRSEVLPCSFAASEEAKQVSAGRRLIVLSGAGHDSDWLGRNASWATHRAQFHSIGGRRSAGFCSPGPFFFSRLVYHEKIAASKTSRQKTRW